MTFKDGEATFKGLVIFIILEGFTIVFLNTTAIFTMVYKLRRNSKTSRRGRKMTPDKQIIISLCLTNFTSGAAVIVEFACFAAGEPISSKKILVLAFIILFSLIASLLHVILLSLERFMALKFPFRHREVKKRSTVLALVFVWVISALPTLTIFINRSGALEIISIIMIITDFFLILSSIYIISVTKKVLSGQNAGMIGGSKTESRDYEKEITRFWSTIMVAYILFTIPPVLIMIFKGGEAVSLYSGARVDGVLMILILLKAIADPLLYILANQMNCCKHSKDSKSLEASNSVQKTYDTNATSVYDSKL
ncbi:lysophosphatidic acid receptor 3-like [Clytia hemisphaerica]|uniref:Seven transmembrane protein n=2 Tax=Clytia hemisphaerica TaxID=252671 RepID=A0A069DM02_9CNID